MSEQPTKAKPEPPVERRVYMVRETAAERKAQGFDHLRYDKIVEHLQKNGWRRQDVSMRFVDSMDYIRAGTERVEWWNLGTQIILLSRSTDDNTCILFRPTTAHRAITSTTRKPTIAKG